MSEAEARIDQLTKYIKDLVQDDDCCKTGLNPVTTVIIDNLFWILEQLRSEKR